MRASILVFLLFFLSCTSREVPLENATMKTIVAGGFTISYSFNCSFPKESRSFVRRGFFVWESLLGVNAFTEVSCGTDATVIVEFSGTDKNFGTKENPIWALGLTDRTYVDPLIGDFRTESIVLTFYPLWYAQDDDGKIKTAKHEVGHVLGLGHGKNPSCIMYPEASGLTDSSDICKEEVEEVLNAYKEMKEFDEQI